MLHLRIVLQLYACFYKGKNSTCNLLSELIMKERRLIWQLIILLFALLSTLVLWHILCIVFLYTEVPTLTEIPAYATHSEQFNFTYPLHLLRNNDYNLLVNYSFSFDILNLGCDEKTLLLVLIHSSPINFKKRSVIRTTWGDKTKSVKLYFVMGMPNESESTQRLLKTENEAHKDLLQGNFLDSYRNLTYKHIVSLKYATYHCGHAKYILKTDDDVFVNMPLFKNFLTFDLSPFGSTNVLFCKLMKNSKVLRTYRSKWRVGFEEYSLRTYPPYCPGWVILYSPDVLFTLYRAAQNTFDVFWIDDVHITGILAAKNNITHTDINKYVISERDQNYLVKDNIFPKDPFLFGRYDLTEIEIKALWNSVITHNIPKSILVGT